MVKVLRIHYTNIDANHWDYKDALNCPVCDDQYTHTETPIEINSNDDYSAWKGVRGGVVKVPIWCEQGHRFSFCFGQHKGATLAYWERGDDWTESDPP